MVHIVKSPKQMRRDSQGSQPVVGKQALESPVKGLELLNTDQAPVIRGQYQPELHRTEALIGSLFSLFVEVYSQHHSRDRLTAFHRHPAGTETHPDLNSAP